ncbi:hypothetical protein NUACC26_038400 [Scytonema sp. NUACC26]
MSKKACVRLATQVNSVRQSQSHTSLTKVLVSLVLEESINEYCHEVHREC